jgi:hypothetical protein
MANASNIRIDSTGRIHNVEATGPKTAWVEPVGGKWVPYGPYLQDRWVPDEPLDTKEKA